jgi:hypothetical protein
MPTYRGVGIVGQHLGETLLKQGATKRRLLGTRVHLVVILGVLVERVASVQLMPVGPEVRGQKKTGTCTRAHHLIARQDATNKLNSNMPL